MDNDERINELNKEIEKSSNKIKKLKIRSNIFGVLPSIVLVYGSTVFTYYNKNNDLFIDLYNLEFFLSLFIGSLCYPSIDIKYNNKIAKEKEIIKKNIDELHGYALLDNEKIMKLKRNI